MIEINDREALEDTEGAILIDESVTMTAVR